MKILLKLNLIWSLLILFQFQANAQVPCEDCITEPFEVVCVETDNGEVLAFPNACFAECEGYTVDDFVECNGGGDPTGCNCTFEFDPVCVDVDGELLTFPNACFAECEGFTEADFIECEDEPWNTDCIECLDEPIEPVCVETEGGIICPFPNACFAICEGYTEDDFLDECETGIDTTGCVCDWEFDPVCVDLDGEILSFPNACFAECEGFTEADFVECDDEPWNTDCIECLDEPIEPVCVETEGGIICPFPNACFAICAGYTEDDFLDECDGWIDTTGCVCPLEFDPVCVDIDGELLTFPNACFAECEGFTIDDFVACDSIIIDPNPTDCDCDLTVIDPVCVELEGEIAEVPNACFAACLIEIIGEGEIVDCDPDGLQDIDGDLFLPELAEAVDTDEDNLLITPNPVEDMATLNLESKEELANATITIMSLNGSIEMVNNAQLVKGANSISLNTSQLKDGIYFLRVQTKSGVQSIRFVK